jgi:hypothetical protein
MVDSLVGVRGRETNTGSLITVTWVVRAGVAAPDGDDESSESASKFKFHIMAKEILVPKMIPLKSSLSLERELKVRLLGAFACGDG